MEDTELEAIKRLQTYIARRITEGASMEEVDKLYDEINQLKSNYYIGQLFSES